MNETIKQYIESQFLTLPQSPEVERAKHELLQMSEDKYRELLEAGVSDNEAIGRVITEFGNLHDLADDLGIRREVSGTAPGDDTHGEQDDLIIFDPVEAEKAVQGAMRSAIAIAAGVFVLLLGLTITSATTDTPVSAQVDASAWSFNLDIDPGGLPFLISVVIAVPLFIIASALNKKFSLLEDGKAAVDYATMKSYQKKLDSSDLRYHTGIAVGVGLILIGVAAASAFEQFSELLFVGVMLGVPVLIIGGRWRTTLSVLSKADRKRAISRSVEAKTEDAVEMIGAIYWPLVTAAYLLWSFIGNAWDRSWIIWPIAGVAFGAVWGITNLWVSRTSETHHP